MATKWSKWTIAWDGKRIPPGGWIDNDQLPCSQIQVEYALNNVDVVMFLATNIWTTRDYLTFHIGEQYKTTAIFNSYIVGADMLLSLLGSAGVCFGWITSDHQMFYEWVKVRERDPADPTKFIWIINKSFLQGGYVDFLWNKHLYTGSWNSQNEKISWVNALRSDKFRFQNLDLYGIIPDTYSSLDTTEVTVNRISKVPKYRVIYTAISGDNQVSPMTNTGLRQNCAEGLLAGEYVKFTSGAQNGQFYTIIDNDSAGLLLMSATSVSGEYTPQGRILPLGVDVSYALLIKDTFMVECTSAWVVTGFLGNSNPISGKFFPCGTLADIKDYNKEDNTTNVLLNVKYYQGLEIPLIDDAFKQDIGLTNISDDIAYSSTSITKSLFINFNVKEYSSGGLYQEPDPKNLGVMRKYNLANKPWRVTKLSRTGVSGVTRTPIGAGKWIETTYGGDDYVVEVTLVGALYLNDVIDNTKFEGYFYKLPNIATRVGAFYDGPVVSIISSPIMASFQGNLQFDLANISLSKDSRVVLDRYWSPRGMVVSSYSPSGCRFFTRAVTGLPSTQVIPTIDCFNYIVSYVKNNDIFVSKVFYSKDLQREDIKDMRKEETKEYQLTFDGSSKGYSSPSVIQLNDTYVFIGFLHGEDVGYMLLNTYFPYPVKWKKNVKYVVGDIIADSCKYYVCIKENTGQHGEEPFNSNYWSEYKKKYSDVVKEWRKGFYEVDDVSFEKKDTGDSPDDWTGTVVENKYYLCIIENINKPLSDTEYWIEYTKQTEVFVPKIVLKDINSNDKTLSGVNPKFKYDKESEIIWMSYQKGSDNYLARSSWDEILKQFVFTDTHMSPIFNASVPSELKYDVKINQVSLTTIMDNKPYTYVSPDGGNMWNDRKPSIPFDYVRVDYIQRNTLKNYLVDGLKMENELLSIFPQSSLKKTKPSGNDAVLSEQYNIFIASFISFLNDIIFNYDGEKTSIELQGALLDGTTKGSSSPEYIDIHMFDTYLSSPATYLSQSTVTFDEMSSIVAEGIIPLSSEPIFFWGKLADKEGVWMYDGGRSSCRLVKACTRQEVSVTNHPFSNQKLMSFADGVNVKVSKSDIGGHSFIDV